MEETNARRILSSVGTDCINLHVLSLSDILSLFNIYIHVCREE